MQFEPGLAAGQRGPLLLGPDSQRRVVRGGELRLERGDAVGQGGDVERLEHGLLIDRWAGVHAGVPVEGRVAEGVEVREELVVVLLRNGVELVVVALGAAKGEPEHGFAERFHAVGVVVHEVLGGDGAALVGVHVVALEARGDELAVRGRREQVPGELLHHELVVGQVVVEGLNDPVPPEPEVASAVDGETVRVGVTRGVEPVEGHAFPEVRAREQARDELRVGLRVLVAHESLHFLGGGRKAGEVERDSTDQRGAVGEGGGREALFLELIADEGVDGMPGRGRGRFLGGEEGPVGLVFGALLNPTLERRLVLRAQLEVRLRRRHLVIGVVAEDALPGFALLGVSGDERGAALVFPGGFFGEVEAELGLTRLFVEAVAAEAVFRKDGADVPVEGQRRFGGVHRASQQAKEKEAACRGHGVPMRQRREVRVSKEKPLGNRRLLYD